MYIDLLKKIKDKLILVRILSENKDLSMKAYTTTLFEVGEWILHSTHKVKIWTWMGLSLSFHIKYLGKTFEMFYRKWDYYFGNN